MLYVGLPLYGYEIVRLLAPILSKAEIDSILVFDDEEDTIKFRKEYLDNPVALEHPTSYWYYLEGSPYSFNENKLNATLKTKTTLRVFWIDKGVYILGFEIDEICANLWAPLTSFEDSLAHLAAKKAEWLAEVTRLGIDRRRVSIAHMEAESEIAENAEPVLINA